MQLIVEADGGSRGNPGPAGFGAVVRDAASGTVVARRNGFLGVTTNNVAEYNGLLAGLKAAIALDPAASVEVRLDSKLVVEQMSGRWQVKSPELRLLASEGSRLASTFPQIRFTWIPRAQNGDADKLANEAMDARRATFDESGDRTPPTWQPVPDAEPIEFVLLRHGQTVHSIDRRFSGTSDPDLTDLGRGQAERAAERLSGTGPFDAIITSPRTRARSTARAVASLLGLMPEVDDAWRECDFGAFEGLSWDEVSARYPAELQAWLNDRTVAPPGGESFVEVAARVTQAIESIVAGPTGRRILVVSHVTPIKVATILALNAPSSALFTLHLDLASITRMDAYRDGPYVFNGWNDTAHLDGLASVTT